MFDASRVRDIGLPTIDNVPRRVEPGEPSPSVPVPGGPTPGSSGSNTPKFQLGETLPVVPARTVCRILRSDFVDMAELSEEHQEFELRRLLEGEEGKPLPTSKLRPVPDLLSWAKAFCHFAGIVVQVHPHKAVDLWAYLAIMLPGSDKGDWRRSYYSRFWQQLPSLEKATFGWVDQALFTKTILATGVGGTQKPTQGPSQDGGGPPKAKRWRASMVCFAWNDGRPCAYLPCRYQHTRSRCGGDHRKSVSGEGHLMPSTHH